MAKQADQLADDCDLTVTGADEDRLHGGVFRLQADSVFVPIKAFQSRLVTDQGDDNVTVVGIVPAEGNSALNVFKGRLQRTGPDRTDNRYSAVYVGGGRDTKPPG